MKIYIAPCNSNTAYREKYLREIIELAENPIYSLSQQPEDADLILVPDTVFTYQHQRALLSKYLDKCYAIGTNTTSHLMIPGLYNNAPTAWWQKYRFRGCSYIFRRDRRSNPFVSYPDFEREKKYIFSFVGSPTSWVRKSLLKMKFKRNDILIRCTNNYSDWKPDANRELMQKTYADIIHDSKFVLCPRGSGWGIIRVFEAMKLGVAPVIISDRWLPPFGPDWHSFALFIKQSELKNLEKIVESHAAEYESRGRLAREAWSKYFADAVVFDRCIAAIEDLKANRISILDRAIFYSYPLILMMNNLKNRINEWIKSIILKLFDLFKLQFPYELVNK